MFIDNDSFIPKIVLHSFVRKSKSFVYFFQQDCLPNSAFPPKYDDDNKPTGPWWRSCLCDTLECIESRKPISRCQNMLHNFCRAWTVSSRVSKCWRGLLVHRCQTIWDLLHLIWGFWLWLSGGPTNPTAWNIISDEVLKPALHLSQSENQIRRQKGKKHGIWYQNWKY